MKFFCDFNLLQLGGLYFIVKISEQFRKVVKLDQTRKYKSYREYLESKLAGTIRKVAEQIGV